jgi:hypothetical protein
MSHLAKILTLYKIDPKLEQTVLKLMNLATEFYNAPNYKEQNDLILSLNQFIYITQKYFFARKDERWDLKIPKWIVKNPIQAFNYSQELNLHQAIYPIEKEFDAFIVFGANKSEIFRRLKFVRNLLKNNLTKKPKQIYLLSGARTLTERIDGSKESINKLKIKYNVNEIFETHLFSDMYDKVIGKLAQDIEKVKVHTPKNKERRPNTFDTILYLLENFPLPGKKLLFISRSPTIFEQKAAVEKATNDKSIYYEVVGGECTYNEVVNEAKAAYHLLMSFAGMLFETYQYVFEKLCEEYGYNYNIENFKKFRLENGYRGQIYDPNIFSAVNFTDF